MPEHLMIEAAYGRPHERIPAWIMRQAGRYIPQYQDIKTEYSFADICASPKLMAEVSMHPVHILGVDAAIIFSDILFPLKPMGLDLAFTGKGPAIANPIRTGEDVKRLHTCNPEKDLSLVLQGIQELRKQLEEKIPLIGFAGSPFTLACYAIEGRGSTDGDTAKTFLREHRDAAHTMLGLLAEVIGAYLKSQIAAGAQLVQVFDSRGSILTTDEYEEFSLPYIQRVCEICQTPGVPRIVFSTDTSPFLELLANLDCEVVSIDWGTDIERAFEILEGKTIQGNLNPKIMLGTADEIRKELSVLLEKVGGRDNYIFNLGHGIPPQTPVVNARLVIETVQNYTRTTTYDR
ncbi:MAG: uroporphyrinogen decarboxylase [Candidatus Zixiibacteriota bacterium]